MIFPARNRQLLGDVQPAMFDYRVDLDCKSSAGPLQRNEVWKWCIPPNGYFDRDNNDKPWDLGLLSVGAGNVLLHQHGHVVNHAHHLTTTRASHPIPSGTCAFRYSKIPH